ncbi:GerMN domain-containing protein [Caldanaerobacter subterraneus]|uniref:Sporulation and spore germination protein n=1 Tax=Caldanaerobacter subterraneus TaxID=911092 RepID=A0A4R2JQC9_9THEO|nr:GerMN domain-containing protein [Caldanaerobacter subterraneus]TCO58989.1 sporulation and spore germination protein [Caldanaerobacter subterraneus]
MKKIFLAIAMVLVLSVVFTGCTRKNQSPESSLSKEEIKVTDYFPVSENLYWEYKGIGNEFAGGRVDIEFIEGNKVQFSHENGGTVVAKVFEVSNEGVKVINSIEESYYRINYLAEEPTYEEYYLKSPIKEKVSWQDGSIVWTIESLNEKVEVPAGEFTCIKVVGKSGDFVLERYFAKGVGLVKQRFVSDNMTVEDNLSKFGDAEKDNCLPAKELTIYYPSENVDKLLEDRVVEKFKTGETLVERITELLKSEKYRVLSKNTRLLDIKKGENVLRLNFSKELITEMNAGSGYEALLIDSIVNTYGYNFGVEGVILNVEGKGYESGHFVFGKDEVLKVNR